MPFNSGVGGNKVVPFFGGGCVPNPCNCIIAQVAPSTNNTESPIGTIYVNTATSTLYICVANTGPAGSVTWEQIGLSTGTVATLTGGSGGAIAPSAGNITLAGTANQITTTGSGSTITWSLPAALTAPGSVTATTTLTATLGDITATNGNFVSSAAGKGFSAVVTTASGAASGPVVCNGRVGSCSFTSPSVAAGASVTFTITNSAITGSSTVVLYSFRGVTASSALSILSVTNSAGSSAIVMTNGTGATTSTATITFDFIVLN